MAAEQPDQCQQSRRDDGGHAWNFDGDDPYMICAWCDQMQDAISGRLIRKGRPSQEVAEREGETRREIDRLKGELGLADSPETLAKALAAADRMRPASGMPRPPAQIDGDGSAAEIGSTGVPEPENSIQAAEWQVCITAADGSGFTIPADADSAHRIADRWRTDLASADVEFLVEAERRFVGMWEPVEEWAHFAPYGSYAAVCGEPVPPGEFWETDRGDWAVARFTTRRAGTTCPKCRRILGYSRQEGQADER